MATAAKPSYHDLYITTAKIPRTSIFDLPHALQVSCTRTRGWTVWRTVEIGDKREDVLEAGEYEGQELGLRLDVAGHTIVDSLTVEADDVS